MIDPIGYRKITLFGRQWLAHRLMWKMLTGEEPDCIDHINGQRADNRFANLRDVSIKDNSRNLSAQRRSKSGCNGVVWVNGKWLAQIRDNDDNYVKIGWFNDLNQAIGARKAAERKYGFHPNHGKVLPKRGEIILRPEIAERNSEVFNLRKSGLTYREIGKRLGLDLSFARKIYLKQVEAANLQRLAQEGK